MKTFEIKTCYSGYCSWRVEAETEEEACKIQKKMLKENGLSDEQKHEILDSLDPWTEADMIEEITEENE